MRTWRKSEISLDTGLGGTPDLLAQKRTQ